VTLTVSSRKLFKRGDGSGQLQQRLRVSGSSTSSGSAAARQDIAERSPDAGSSGSESREPARTRTAGLGTRRSGSRAPRATMAQRPRRASGSRIGSRARAASSWCRGRGYLRGHR
jgi:hypothetical protein